VIRKTCLLPLLSFVILLFFRGHGLKLREMVLARSHRHCRASNLKRPWNCCAPRYKHRRRTCSYGPCKAQRTLEKGKQAGAGFVSPCAEDFPDYLPALEGAAQIQYEAGDPAAIPLIEHVLRLRPKDAISHGMLAVLETSRGSGLLRSHI